MKRNTSKKGQDFAAPCGPGSAKQDAVSEHAKTAATAQDQPLPPGLDAARHAKSQRAAQQGEFLRDGRLPALLATALGLDTETGGPAAKVFLQGVISDAAEPADPVERMLLEQLAFAHLRIAELHASAGTAQSLEAIKIYNSLASRLLGEFRRTALALKIMRSHAPKSTSKSKLKIHKMAQ